RGYPIEEVVEHATYEDVCLLLWKGERPARTEVERLRRAIGAAQMPPPVASALSGVGQHAPSLLRLAVMMPVLAAHQRNPARLRSDDAREIIRMMPLAIIPPGTRDPERRRQCSGTAERLLQAFAGANPRTWEQWALDRVLVACAEHELNA